ncbi:hypothetical protein ACHWQZ_G008686 [Mnemiopsis leidyi]
MESEKSEINGIQNEVLRYSYVTYLLFVTLSCFVGDTLVLIGTIKFGAIKINKVLVVIIQHIALLNILTCITYVLPQVVSLIRKRWVLGYFLCHINSIAAFYLVSVNQLLTCCIAIMKVFMLKFPNSPVVRGITSKSAHAMCFFVWALALMVPGLCHVVEKGAQVFFDARKSVCEFMLTSPLWTMILPLLTVVTFLIPYLVVILSTFFLVEHLVISWRLSQQVGGRRRWQGIIVVFITTAVFSIATMPYYIYIFVGYNQTDFTSFFHNDFLRIAEACYNLNLISNFYIYSMTLQSFRNFLSTAAQSCASFWSKSYPSFSFITKSRAETARNESAKEESKKQASVQGHSQHKPWTLNSIQQSRTNEDITAIKATIQQISVINQIEAPIIRVSENERRAPLLESDRDGNADYKEKSATKVEEEEEEDRHPDNLGK